MTDCFCMCFVWFLTKKTGFYLLFIILFDNGKKWSGLFLLWGLYNYLVDRLVILGIYNCQLLPKTKQYTFGTVLKVLVMIYDYF